jgi:hypothetical protein
MAGNRERSSLVPRGVDFDQVLKSVVIDVICGTVVQVNKLRHMFQLVRHGMEHRHTMSPLWHGFLLEGLSVLHAFTCDARTCEKNRGNKKGRMLGSLSGVLCTNVPCVGAG